VSSGGGYEKRECVMFRVLGLIGLVLALGAVVASGVQHGFTALHFKMGVPLLVLAVIAVVPTRKTARQDARVR
jgi:hypothetical protein